jgi:UDP-N-acetylglucosamine kinase
MTPEEEQICQTAIDFARGEKKTIAKRLTDPNIFLPEAAPVSVFMAGSPCAGKTEASIALLEQLMGDRLFADPPEWRDRRQVSWNCCVRYDRTRRRLST